MYCLASEGLYNTRKQTILNIQRSRIFAILRNIMEFKTFTFPFIGIFFSTFRFSLVLFAIYLVVINA